MSYIINNNEIIGIPKHADNSLISKIIGNYTYGREWNVKNIFDENVIMVGKAEIAEIGDSEYAINVTEKGASIKGADYASLMRGFFTMLEKLCFDEVNEQFYIENCSISEKPSLSFRCVHLCVFPETKLDFLQKCMRACAAAKFSHVILDFWGMLKLDCLKELSWPFAYSKEKMKKLIYEINAWGVEIIPMFNHLGHASACREINGKHVVLDQNPKYEYMFDSYGWVWKYQREDVYELLAKIRGELIEVCGQGSYFHIGCDEAYAIGNDEKKAEDTAKYLNSVAKELIACGRRPIMWHDMLLDKNEFEGYVANSEKIASEVLLNQLDKNIIIADWQYDVHNETWKSSEKLKENGFDVLCCSWSNNQNVEEAIKTVDENKLFGIIHTTWHDLFKSFRTMIYAGAISYNQNLMNARDVQAFYAAYITRKVMPAHGEYEISGWSKKMTGVGLL